MARTRLTVFSRFLLFMLIALPVIYVAASFYNGEDPVANVKGWLGMDREDAVEQRQEAPATAEQDYSILVDELRAENERLHDALERCQSGVDN